MGKILKRIKELGLILPPCPIPVGSFVTARRAGDLVYAAGQTPWQADGTLLFPGKVGCDVTPEQAYQAARLAALRLLSELAAEVDLDDIQFVKVNGYVNAVSDFGDHPIVINGASDLLVEIFGERGRHARTAVGVASLPNNASVEVEVIARIAEAGET